MSTGGFLKRSVANKKARELLERLGHSEISVTRTVGTLSPAGQQIVSMARALSHDTKLLILAQPSAVLDQEEVRNLFRVVKNLTTQGVAVIYISHRLEEIRQIGDRITVLKDGRTVATGLDARETPTKELIQLMTGRSIEYVFPPRPTTPRDRGDVVLDVSDLAVAGVFSVGNMTVHAGEIVGLAGLMGSGRTEVARAIFGADPFANNGDAALGFWFFKEDVGVDNGGFSGNHTDDDLLVQVDFVNGGSSSEIQIFRWKGAGTGSHGTLDELQFEAANGAIVCTDDDSACAITNDSSEPSPWNYAPKSGVAGTFPQESFYEGAIDVTALIGEVCFSSFMAETRTSHSETAELADFALGDFNLCSIAVAKSCTSGPVIDEGGTFLTSTMTVTVTNDGFGPVYDPAFEEDIAIPGNGVLACRLVSPTVDNDLDQDELKQVLAGELGAGDSATAVVECDHSTSKVFNNVTARAAASPGGTRDITASYQMDEADTCELLITPMIDVEKECKTVKIVQVGDTLQPQVCNTITLTNTSNEKLVNVSLVDNPSNADPTTLISGGDLGPRESITPIEHCYTPTATDSGTEEPEEATFSNEVLASGDGAISGSEATDGDNVQCKLCPPPQSEQLH